MADKNIVAGITFGKSKTSAKRNEGAEEEQIIETDEEIDGYIDNLRLSHWLSFSGY